MFQSVSGLWDRRNPRPLRSPPAWAGFNPSPVCGTGEMRRRMRLALAGGVSIRLRSVGPEKLPGIGDESLKEEFQSVSGLWDRRNHSPTLSVSIRLRSVGPEKLSCSRRSRGGWSFNPSPVCGTGEIGDVGCRGSAERFQSVSGLWDRRNERTWARQRLVEVSIRLRSVGPEKCGGANTPSARSRFQSVSGLWDRRNPQHPVGDAPHAGFNPSPVCGTGEMRTGCGLLRLDEFQSVSGLWDRRNTSAPISTSPGSSFNPSPVCGTGEMTRSTYLLIVLRFQSVSGLWDRRNS